jgi:hypothetical protein
MGDESEFYYQCGRDRIRTARDENTPDVASRTVAFRKRMLTVFGNLHGFHVITMLPPIASFNASWFIDGNLVSLVENFFPVGRSTGRRKVVVHLDSAPIDNSRRLRPFSGTAR